MKIRICLADVYLSRKSCWYLSTFLQLPCSYGATHCFHMFRKVLNFASSPPPHGLFYERFVTPPDLILYRVLPSVSPFKLHYPFFSFKSSSSCLSLLPLILIPSVASSIMCFRTVRTVCSVKLKLRVLFTKDEFCFAARRRAGYEKNLARSSLLTIW